MKFAFVTNAEIEYRAAYENGCTCTNPNNWCSAIVEDENGKRYKAWFEMDDEVENLEDACDWDDFSDLESYND